MPQTTKHRQENQCILALSTEKRHSISLSDWLTIRLNCNCNISSFYHSFWHKQENRQFMQLKCTTSCSSFSLHWHGPPCCSHDLLHITYLVVDRFSLDDISTIRNVLFCCTQLFRCSYIKLFINRATWWSAIIDIPSWFGWRKLNKGHNLIVSFISRA